jgi:hypothetical protein
MTDEMEKAKRGVIDAIKELFRAWRKTDQVGGPEDFFDSTFTPCIDAALKELSI